MARWSEGSEEHCSAAQHSPAMRDAARRALDAGEPQRSRAWGGRCSPEAHSPDLRHLRQAFREAWLRVFSASEQSPRPPQRP